MTKKEYILSVLELFPDWEMGRGIKAMILNDQVEEHTLNLLVIAFKRAMDKLTKVIKENKMLETIQAVEKFGKQKEEQAKKDEKVLQDLDSRLNDF